MEQLREALESALHATTFDDLRADEYRALVQSHSWRDEAYERAHSAAVQIAEHRRSLLTNLIRAQLGSLVNPSSDSIGLAFQLSSSSGSYSKSQPDGTTTLQSESTVDEFVAALVRGTAMLGAERMLSLFAGWLSGDPVRHRVRTLLNCDGVLSGALEPISGVRVESLALSTDQFREFLPLDREPSLTDYLGRIVVSIEHPMSPALFRLRGGATVQSLRAASLPGLETICQALSLELDAHVSPAFSWHDYGELDACGLSKDSATWSRAAARVRLVPGTGVRRTSQVNGVTTLKLDPETHLRVDPHRLRATLMALNDADAKTRRAASRWLSSKDSSEERDDRYIDLRIALESLYLQDFPDDRSQEMRFRLALFAAWHLGDDLSERREIRKRTRQAYNTASGAVHAGQIEFNEENENLLRDAQALCRRGILKLLERGQPADWSDLILGSDVESA